MPAGTHCTCNGSTTTFCEAMTRNEGRPRRRRIHRFTRGGRRRVCEAAMIRLRESEAGQVGRVWPISFRNADPRSPKILCANEAPLAGPAPPREGRFWRRARHLPSVNRLFHLQISRIATARPDLQDSELPRPTAYPTPSRAVSETGNPLTCDSTSRSSPPLAGGARPSWRAPSLRLACGAMAQTAPARTSANGASLTAARLVCSTTTRNTNTTSILTRGTMPPPRRGAVACQA